MFENPIWGFHEWRWMERKSIEFELRPKLFVWLIVLKGRKCGLGFGLYL